MKLLNETEAAVKFGITKELLYAYVRNAPKQHLGHNRKLLVKLLDGSSYFDEDEILSFDAYLKEPWSNPGEPRPKIPTYIQDYLQTEIGGQCPITGVGAPLDNAHIADYAVSLNHHHHNLIRIAKNEHAKFDNGIYSKKDLQELKNKIVEKTRSKLRENKTPFQDSYSPKLPNTLYIGQVEKLIELVTLMEYEPLILIQGVAGIGKTQLLLNALQNVKYHFPVVWIDVERINSVQELVIALKEAIIKVCNSSNEQSLIKLLNNNQISIIFDSLEKLLLNQRDEVEDFLTDILKNVANVQIIITSQVDLSLSNFTIQKVKVSGLDDDSSLELLKQSISENLSINNADWILAFCEGHPLALKLIGQLISYYKSSSQVETYLKKNGSIKRPLRKQHNKETALEICFITVYEVFDYNQKRILYYLMYCPGGVKILWAQKFFEKNDFVENIPYLKQFFLIEETYDTLEFARISLTNPIKPLLREVGGLTNEDNNKIVKEVLENIVIEALVIDDTYIENNKSDSFSYGIQRLEDDLPNLFFAFSTAQEHLSQAINNEDEVFYSKIIGSLSTALGRFCFT